MDWTDDAGLTATESMWFIVLRTLNFIWGGIVLVLGVTNCYMFVYKK